MSPPPADPGPRTARHSSRHSSLLIQHGGLAVWAFRGGVWELSADDSAAGFEPGGPPEEPGAYEGEVVRKLSVRSRN